MPPSSTPLRTGRDRWRGCWPTPCIAGHTPLREVLPPAGLLAFFYDAEQQPWGFDPRDRDGWQVSFIPPGTPLVRAEVPADLPDDGRYREVGLAVEPQLTYAPWESFAVEQLGVVGG